MIGAEKSPFQKLNNECVYEWYLGNFASLPFFLVALQENWNFIKKMSRTFQDCLDDISKKL